MIYRLLTILLMMVIAEINGFAANSEKSYEESSCDDYVSKSKIHYGGNIELTHCFYWEDFLRTTSGQASFTTTHGVHLNQRVFVGLGTGFTFFYGHDWIGGHIPIFADCKYTVPNRHWRPFADFKLGYAWGSSCGLAQPAIGIKFAFKERLGLYLSMGTSVYFAGYIDNGAWCNGLNVSLGFDF